MCFFIWQSFKKSYYLIDLKWALPIMSIFLSCFWEPWLPLFVDGIFCLPTCLCTELFTFAWSICFCTQLLTFCFSTDLFTFCLSTCLGIHVFCFLYCLCSVLVFWEATIFFLYVGIKLSNLSDVCEISII